MKTAMRRILAGVILLLTMGLAPTLRAQSNSPVQYLYDDLGRLVRVVDQNGNVATYQYDAVGNLLAITRSALPGSGGLAILGFTPQQGPVGATVTIQGQGFSTTPSGDAVQFNGVAASVTAATTTSLTATVPVGASTGPISVTVGGVTVTSSSSFTVTSLASIALSPAGSTIAAGGTQQFHASGTYGNGTAGDITTSVVWSSSNTSVAAISNAAGSQGLATAGSVSGSTTVTATLGSISGSTSLQVATLSSISVSPQNQSILLGATQQFTAMGTYSNGATQNLTNLVAWSSGNLTAATISDTAGSQGLATAVATGTTNIQAALGSVTGFTNFAVLALSSVAVSATNQSLSVGQVQPFVATARFSDGSSQTVTTSANWSSNNPAVATVSNSSGTQGVIVAVAVGQTSVCASYTAGGATQQGCSTVYVNGISVTPSSASVPKGGTVSFSAQGELNGSTPGTRFCTWSSSNPSVATVNNSGLATAVGIGTTTITASYESMVGSATLTVTPAVPNSLTVTPAMGTILQGGAIQLEASTVMTDGSAGPVVTQEAAWTTSYPTIATVGNAAGSQGLVTGVGLGAVTITASYGSLNSASATLIVTSPTASVFARFAYVANQQDNTISMYTVNPGTGQFRANGYVAELAGSSPAALALDAASRFLFVANSGASNVAVYAVNAANGTLTPVPGSPFSTGPSPSSVATDPTANYVFVVNSGTYPGTVSAFAFDPTTGMLTAVGGSPFAVGSNPKSVAVDPLGNFLYVTNSGSNTISGFTIDPAGGALTPIPGSPFYAGQNPLGVTVDPADKFVLVADAGTTTRHGSSLSLPDGGGGSTGSRAAIAAAGSRVGGSAFAPATGSWSQAEPSEGGLVLVAANGHGDWDVSRPTKPRHGIKGILPKLEAGGGGTAGSGVSVLSINPTTGALSMVLGSPFTTNLYAFSPNSVMVDPTDTFAFAESTGNDSIAMFTIDASSGNLTFVSSVSTGPLPSSMVMDPSGLFLYTTIGEVNNISLFVLFPSAGSLVPLGNLPTRQGPSAIAISAGAAAVKYVPQFAYVAASGGTANGPQGSNNISGFAVDPIAGALSVLSGSPFAEGLFPQFATTDLLGRFLFVANRCSDAACAAYNGSVSAYQIDPVAGLLTPAPGTPFSAGVGPLGAVVDPSGQFAYVANGTDNTISAYSIVPGTSALLVPIPGSVSLSGGVSGKIEALAIDPAGQFLYAATGCPDGSCAGAIYVYEIMLPTGALRSLLYGAYPLPAGLSPSCLVVEPRGEFLYAADSVSGEVLAFATNGGFPTAISGSPFAAGSAPSSITVDPLGRFLYVANTDSNNISAYTIAPGTGVLAPMPASPFAAGSGPLSLAVDVSGSFLYVVNGGDNTVSAFSIDPAYGVLTPVAGSPFLAGTLPVSITTMGKAQ
jgi:YD repeat-containing protein